MLSRYFAWNSGHMLVLSIITRLHTLDHLLCTGVTIELNSPNATYTSDIKTGDIKTALPRVKSSASTDRLDSTSGSHLHFRADDLSAELLGLSWR